MQAGEENFPKPRDQRCHLLQVKTKVLPYGDIGSEAGEGAGGRERTVEAPVCGHGTGERNALNFYSSHVDIGGAAQWNRPLEKFCVNL